MKNKYVRRSRISEAKFRDLVRCFALDLEANKIALLTQLNRNTVNRYLFLIRQRIAEVCEHESPFRKEIEVDESYFGARRVKVERGHRAYGKTPVFGILQRGGRIYTEIIPDCARATWHAIARGRLDPKSVIRSDGWRGYNSLVDLLYKKHYRLPNDQDQFAEGKNHIKGIESFWPFAKARLMKFNGLCASTIYLHLKESEFRFNYRGQNLYAILLKTLREKPLNPPSPKINFR